MTALVAQLLHNGLSDAWFETSDHIKGGGEPDRLD